MPILTGVLAVPGAQHLARRCLRWIAPTPQRDALSEKLRRKPRLPISLA